MHIYAKVYDEIQLICVVTIEDEPSFAIRCNTPKYLLKTNFMPNEGFNDNEFESQRID